MERNRFISLLDKYLADGMTREEAREFLAAAGEGEHADILEERIQQGLNLRLPDMPGAGEQAREELLRTILGGAGRKGLAVRGYFRRVAAAAAVLLLVLTGYFLLRQQSKEVSPPVAAGNEIIKDAAPGHAGALLQLSNGTTILLDTAGDGAVATGFAKHGELLQVSAADVGYATVTTPYGRKQQVSLPDGTKVWLNAGSAITFPTTFTGGIRSVDMKGEAYFEVEKDPARPFIVKTGNQQIEVLGTHFNVNAYADEPVIKTSLLEGSVRVTAGGSEAVLRPGEQARLGANGLSVATADTDAAIAWVQGYFRFERDDIRSVMRQLGRWYNVQVIYEGEIPGELFGGKIQRDLNLSEVLDLLNAGGVHYRLEGDRITIKP